jgi:hypothetical protein
LQRHGLFAGVFLGALWPGTLLAQAEKASATAPASSALPSPEVAPATPLPEIAPTILPQALPLSSVALARPVWRPPTATLFAPRVDYNLANPNRDGSNYVRALLGTIAVNYTAWQWDYFAEKKEMFYITREIIGDNVSQGFEYDEDSFKTNFFAHPYHGSLYWGAARGAGLSFWESLPFPWIGSLMWEFMGETQAPSPNDFIDTSYGGTVIGEALFRLANEVLDDSVSGSERTWREIGAASLSPMYGLQRVTDARAWRTGPPPKRKKRVNVRVEGGINRLSAENLEGEKEYEPSLHVGIDIVYGDLLPEGRGNIIEPYQFFEAYGAASFVSSKVRGGQLWIQAPMYGWSHIMGDPETAFPDNRVFAVTQFIDFESANLVEFGGLGLGVGEYLVWRFRNGMRYRISGDASFAVLAGVTSLTEGPNGGRTYDYTAGASVGLVSRFDMRRYGELGFRGRHYFTAVLDGGDGTELIGYYRFWYAVPLFERLGVGIAPILAQRTSRAETAEPDVVNVSSVMGELYLFGAF